MRYLFEIVSPGSDLDGEEWEVEAATFQVAEARADARLVETFALASAQQRAATSLRLVGMRESSRGRVVACTRAARRRSAA